MPSALSSSGHDSQTALKQNPTVNTKPTDGQPRTRSEVKIHAEKLHRDAVARLEKLRKRMTQCQQQTRPIEATKRQPEPMDMIEQMLIDDGETFSDGVIDEFIPLQDGGQLRCVSTGRERAFLLENNNSWLYLERANDASVNVLYVVLREESSGRVTVKTLIQ